MTKKIIFSCCGETLGHVTKGIALIEAYPEIEFHVFTYGRAYELLERENYPYLYKVPGLTFAEKDGELDYIGTVLKFFKFMCNIDEYVYDIQKQIYKIHPDSIIVDFEPLIPRASNNLGLKYISLDSQHFFTHCDFSELSFRLKFWAYFIKFYTEFLIPNPDTVQVSLFYSSIVKREKPCLLEGPYLRQLFFDVEPTKGDYILFYYNPAIGNKIPKYLLRYSMYIYGYKGEPWNCTSGLWQFFKPNNEQFIRHLAGCKAVVCGAGIQLLGEAIHYKKPIFSIPAHEEQEINGYYLEKGGWGKCVSKDRVTPTLLENFINES